MAAALVVVVVIGVLAWPTFPQPFLAAVRVARLLGWLVLLISAFVGWGHWLCRCLRVEGASLIAQGAVGAVVTATLWGYLAPWWFPNALLAVPWLLMGWLLLVLDWRSAVAARLVATSTAPAISRVLWSASLLFLLPPLLVALAPPIAIDSLIYHLAIPKQAALLGRLAQMPWIAYSWFPLHAEMLYGLALPLGGGELAQLLHLTAAAAAVTTAARIAARCFGPVAAPWTALLLATAPILNLIAGVAGNDWFVALYVALALEQHLRADDEPSGRPALALEAIFLGAAVATKYTALPALVLLLLPRGARSWRRLAVQLGLVLVVALPWYGRNLLLRGNPVYPLLSGSPAAAALSHFRGDAPLLARLHGYLFEPNLVDEWPGLLLPAAAALAVFVLPRRRRNDSAGALKPGQPLDEVGARRRLDALVPRALLALVVVLALPALIAYPTARSFTPLLLLLAVLGGGALAVVASLPAARAALVAAALALSAIQLAAIFAVWQLDGHEPMRVVAGLEDEDDYLRRTQPYLDAYRTLSQHADADARVLLVGETRAFYLDRPAIWGSVVDPDPFASFAGSPPNPALAERRLRDAGVRLVYFFPPQHRAAPRPPGIRHELEQYVTPELDRAFRQMLAAHARPVFHRGNSWIFALRGDEPPASPATVPPTAVSPTTAPPSPTAPLDATPTPPPSGAS